VRTVLHLPFPPSVNGLYSGGMNTKRRFTSDKYRAWQDMAYIALLQQPARMDRHTGPVQVIYLFSQPDKRRRDLANLEKAVSDLLVKHLIIEDDSHIKRLHIEWCDHPHAATVIIEPYSGPAGYETFFLPKP
jgi:crossover junction endodeoxyribonuclease RusA